MAMKALLLLLAASLLLLPTTGEMTIRRMAEAAAAHPHGLPFESPLALSPAAYEFFHPRARAQLAGARAPGLAPRGQPRGANGVSAASVARADHEEGAAGRPGARRGGAVRAGVVAGVFAGAAAVVLAALGLAYAVARRRVGVVAHGGGDAEAEAAGAAKSSA
ncbi:uncharacterized protein LOC100831139 [Brachypodium distachyon]|uniref:Uncharacterized protein n=1 Tax=Brachypodium distachyon TaxID=15368 RepID=I1I4S4_BRADI|nr:uncharacterized protein LOC100831139 [Brachypodium distachyon]KQJ97137.1 hypothetical protein BRADI_3g29000v3 [Brachypodium distachyon]|eukprot:XP_003571890.1 uncharacterized protein LOC100831139 [Brachypodium distachyon]